MPAISPKTIDELDSLAKEYTTSDSDGNLTQAGFIPWLHWEGAITGYNWNAMFGGRWYDVENRKWTINTPENQADVGVVYQVCRPARRTG